MVIAMLGIMKAGAAYAPIDGSYPEERVRYMLEDAGVRVMLTQGESGRRVEEKGMKVEVIDLERRWEEIGEESEESPGVETGGEDLAYVIYTSGSTGRPKGVMVKHGGLANYLKWASEAYRIKEGEGSPVHSSVAFDLTVTSLYGPLVNGKRVDLLSEGDGIEALAAALSRESEYSLVKITPAHLDVLAQQMRDTDVGGSARALVIGGEELRVGGLKFWQERARETRLINEYGPTETVVGCSVYEVEAGKSGVESTPIGKPIANTHMYILDEDMKPMPIGARGEIYISGAGVARGYLGKPDLTAERFVPNPFNRIGGDRAYRTGDVGRYLSDGNIEFEGRADDQVKIRGYRIELGEIQAALDNHPSVRQSVVVANKAQRGDKRLVGYVVGEKGATSVELKKHLKERLPDYMVPEVIVTLDEMPVTANGKIDRKRLPPVEDAGRQAQQAYVGARTPVEEMLVGIFEEVLKLSGVGIHDNFFEIGGHSLLATQVVSRVRNTFGVEVGVRSVFEESTVEGLGRKIEEAMKAGETEGAAPLRRIPREGIRGVRLPLSFAQQRLWFLDQLEPGSTVYNCPGAVRLEGRLDLEALERVFNEIVRRHEVLRTRIEVEDGEPVQVIDEWEPRKLEVEDLTGLTREEREQAVSRMAREEAETGFDLRRGPLLRVKVLRLEEAGYVLLYTMHHIVSDGWSRSVLLREMEALYSAYSRGEESPLPELPVQYADYAAWQREWLRDGALEAQLSYWTQHLEGAPPLLDLPTDHPRPQRQSFKGAREPVTIPRDVYQSLEALSRREGVTLFMTLLAAWQTLLRHYSGQEDIVVCTPTANRNLIEIEGLIGFFANTLALRTDLSGNPTFRELLSRVREVTLNAYRHQDLPFEKLVGELQPERSLSHHSIAQVVFVLQNAPMHHPRLTELSLAPLDIAHTTAKFDLTFNLSETDRGLLGSLEYSADLFEASTIRRMLTHFVNLLRSVAAQPDNRLGALEFLSEEEKITLEQPVDVEAFRETFSF